MIIVLYENEDWLMPLVSSLEKKNLPYQTRFVNGGQIDISRTPEKAVYINRMSPSSHTRGHMDGVLLMREYLSVLEAHGMPIINGSNSFSFEFELFSSCMLHNVCISNKIPIVWRKRAA